MYFFSPRFAFSLKHGCFQSELCFNMKVLSTNIENLICLRY
uniref:Uncharacterized protein n=1 Tax=Anguilla anguilla TaxID=7936 RepID=A0A0E9XLY7_ANGAN